MQSIAPAPGPQSMQNQEMLTTDNDLRAQLAAVINTSSSNVVTGPHGYNDLAAASGSASPHENNNIDPAIGGVGGVPLMSAPGGRSSSAGPAGDSGGDDSLGDGRRGGKRELSQSKRAAQNRAAQRAFRQRKEGYIKKLEEQVRELHALEENYKAIQSENYTLREYIIHLQSRLLESQGEYPQPPPNVNLSHPQQRQHEHLDHLQRHDGGPSMAPMAPMTMQASAARGLAAASLGGVKHSGEGRYKEAGNDDAADEEIIRSQLGGADGLPTSMSM